MFATSVDFDAVVLKSSTARMKVSFKGPLDFDALDEEILSRRFENLRSIDMAKEGK